MSRTYRDRNYLGWTLALGLVVSGVSAGLSLGLAQPVMAADSPIAVLDVWTRAPAAGVTETPIYLKVWNKSAAEDRFVGVTSPIAGQAMLMHDSEDHSVKFMMGAGTLELPGNYAITFVPGGSHVMLTGLKKTLKAGDTFPITLIFANADRQEVAVKVLAANAIGPK